MTFDDLGAIDWDALRTPDDWAKKLGELLDLAKSSPDAEQCALLARTLDQFANNSGSDTDFSTIAKLDVAARGAARALRTQSTEHYLAEIRAASGEYASATKELDAVRAQIRKETRLLRAEKALAATTSLTNTIGALRELADSASDASDSTLRAAIKQAVEKASALRNLLEAAG